MHVAGAEVDSSARSKLRRVPGVDWSLGMGFANDSGSADGGLAAAVAGIAHTPSLALVVYNRKSKVLFCLMGGA